MHSTLFASRATGANQVSKAQIADALAEYVDSEYIEMWVEYCNGDVLNLEYGGDTSLVDIFDEVTRGGIKTIAIAEVAEYADHLWIARAFKDALRRH